MDMPDPDGEYIKAAIADFQAWQPVEDQIDFAHALAEELDTLTLEGLTAQDILDSLAVAGLQLIPGQPFEPVPETGRRYERLSVASAAYFRLLQDQSNGLELIDERWWLAGNDAD